MDDTSQSKPNSDDCLIPPPVEPEALERYLLKQSPFDGSDEIRAYVEDESVDEQVVYLERMVTERVLGHDHAIWDVHTTGERYWVVTNPTNLYSQRLFPSADYTLTFHIGLAARISSRRDGAGDDEQEARLISAWRRWTQTAEALDHAHEAEEFQAVGMRCRECLLSLVRSTQVESMVPFGQETPQVANFLHWSELIADAIAGGSSAKEVRSYLKTTARSAWQLVSWLTHATHATTVDGELAVEATHSTLTAYGLALLGFERGIPSHCPECGSYRIATRYAPEVGLPSEYVVICEACGWLKPDLERSTIEERA